MHGNQTEDAPSEGRERLNVSCGRGEGPRKGRSGGLRGRHRSGQARDVARRRVAVDDALGGGAIDGLHGHGETRLGGVVIVARQRTAHALDVGAHGAEVHQISLATLESLTVSLFCLLVICHGRFVLGGACFGVSSGGCQALSSVPLSPGALAP